MGGDECSGECGGAYDDDGGSRRTRDEHALCEQQVQRDGLTRAVSVFLSLGVAALAVSCFLPASLPVPLSLSALLCSPCQPRPSLVLRSCSC